MARTAALPQDGEAGLWTWLRTGRALPAEVWRRRHRWLLQLLAAHVVVLAAVLSRQAHSPGRVLAEVGGVGVLCVVAFVAGDRHRGLAALAVAVGLMFAAELVVHAWDGVGGSYLHVFVLVGTLALYQDWRPFAAAVLAVVLYDGVIGTLAPAHLYGDAAAQHRPWLWAVVHGGYVLATAVVSLTVCAVNQRDHERQQRQREQHVLELAWSNEQLQALVLDDELTGLRNRRGFLVLGEHELLVAQRAAIPVTLLFIDVDGLKVINDGFGHAAGDAALVETAEVLRATYREADVIGRVGGDEFCVLLADAADDACPRARLQQAVEARNREPDRTFALSLSVGSARYDSATTANIAGLLHEADQAMYADKHGINAPSMAARKTRRGRPGNPGGGGGHRCGNAPSPMTLSAVPGTSICWPR